MPLAKTPRPRQLERRMVDATQPPKRHRGVKPGTKRGPYKNRGKPRLSGRQKGQPNTFTRDMKQAVINGIRKFGRDGRGTDGVEGFVYKLCRDHAAVAGALLRAVLPLEIKADFIQEVNVPYETLDDALEAARAAGMPEARIAELQQHYMLPPPDEDVSELELVVDRSTTSSSSQ